MFAYIMKKYNGYILSKHVCDYRLRNPISDIRQLPMPICGMGIFPALFCPLYAPVVPDTPCRYCNRNAIEHRKYYLYSMYCRKIQNVYFQYKYNCIIKYFLETKKNKYTNQGVYCHIELMRQYYKHKRNWSLNQFKQYINHSFH